MSSDQHIAIVRTGCLWILRIASLVAITACTGPRERSTITPSAQLPTLPATSPEQEISDVALSPTTTVIPVVLGTALPVSPTTISATSTTAFVTAVSARWTIYHSPEGGYSVPIPTDWPINDATQGRGLLIEFKDPANQAGGDDNTVRGGIDMPGRYPGAPGDEDLSAGLPDNHREILFEQSITTVAGRGKVFTLKRDSPPAQNLIWFEQHAIIPTDNKFYDIWLKIPEPGNGDPTPELAHMLEGFRLK